MLGDICDPFAVGSFCVEFSVQQIFILVYLLLQLFPLSAPADFRQQAVAFHKSEDGFGILVAAVLVQPELHSAIAVGILTPFLLTCNLIYDCLIRVWLAQSLNIRIIPASGNAKESAHPVNGMVLPVTVQGADELTTLASCLDSMRKTLNRQHQEKAETDARVKNLITEMSHDLRTPLTTLLLYTEIVRDGRYDGQAQLQEYLAKIDTKARQIKQMSDNLFEYALVTRDAPADMDPPARFSQIFEEPLADMAEQLQQHGFACALRLGGEDVVLTVRGQYVRRVLDNITSNLLKYADPSQPVEVDYVRDETRARLSFANQALPEAPGTDRTRVGLESVQAMMARMQADVRVEREPGHYRITLLFPITQE